MWIFLWGFRSDAWMQKFRLLNGRCNLQKVLKSPLLKTSYGFQLHYGTIGHVKVFGLPTSQSIYFNVLNFTLWWQKHNGHKIHAKQVVTGSELSITKSSWFSKQMHKRGLVWHFKMFFPTPHTPSTTTVSWASDNRKTQLPSFHHHPPVEPLVDVAPPSNTSQHFPKPTSPLSPHTNFCTNPFFATSFYLHLLPT